MMHRTRNRFARNALFTFCAAVLALAAAAPPAAGQSAPAMRWWNSLNAEQMVAALFGDMATAEQKTAAQKMYADLDAATKKLVDAAAAEIYGAGGFDSVGAWWESLDCRKMRIAAGDGATADPSSAFCAHYPGSGAAKIMGAAAIAHVNKVGQALLGRMDPGVYPSPDQRAMRWWNSLNGPQMVAALYGSTATPAQSAAAMKMYADLDSGTKGRVDVATAAIYGAGGFDSVGAWWETLDCRKMRIAAGDGATADPSSPFCAHYPGSGISKILGAASKSHVDKVGQALLGREDLGVFPPDIPAAMRWWNSLNGPQMVAALHGTTATPAQSAAAMKMYADLDSGTKGYVNAAFADIYGPGGFDSVGAWWEWLHASSSGSADAHCRKMRVAVGDGNVGEQGNAFCTHYPGSRLGAGHRILDAASKRRVDKVGQALLGRVDRGTYPPVPGSPALLYSDARCSRDGLCRVKVGQTVKFRDATGASSRRWDIQGGELSRETVVSHSWSAPGYYDVTLTVSNGSKRGTATTTFLVESSEPVGLCVPTARNRCLQDSRYSLTMRWWAENGSAGVGHVVNAGTNDSGLFSFHASDNWEVLIKVLDGCSVNRNAWVLGASATDLGYEIRVTDTMTGAYRTYRNEVGRPASAIVDTAAFSGVCGTSPRVSGAKSAGPFDSPLAFVSPQEGVDALEPVTAALTNPCVDSATSLCLLSGRYEVTVDWSANAQRSSARVARARTTDSGLFYFFDPENWEMIVKVLDGCSVNQRQWVFAAAATDVGFDLTVTDRVNGNQKKYTKKAGRPAPAFVDTAAFPMGCAP